MPLSATIVGSIKAFTDLASGEMLVALSSPGTQDAKWVWRGSLLEDHLTSTTSIL